MEEETEERRRGEEEKEEEGEEGEEQERKSRTFTRGEEKIVKSTQLIMNAGYH